MLVGQFHKHEHQQQHQDPISRIAALRGVLPPNSGNPSTTSFSRERSKSSEGDIKSSILSRPSHPLTCGHPANFDDLPASVAVRKEIGITIPNEGVIVGDTGNTRLQPSSSSANTGSMKMVRKGDGSRRIMEMHKMRRIEEKAGTADEVPFFPPVDFAKVLRTGEGGTGGTSPSSKSKETTQIKPVSANSSRTQVPPASHDKIQRSVKAKILKESVSKSELNKTHDVNALSIRKHLITVFGTNERGKELPTKYTNPNSSEAIEFLDERRVEFMEKFVLPAKEDYLNGRLIVPKFFEADALYSNEEGVLKTSRYNEVMQILQSLNGIQF